MSSSQKDKCFICEKLFNQEDDVVTTSCDHTYHRSCAENRVNVKNRSDCRVCEKSSALADALLPKTPIIEGECKICEKAFKLEEDLVTTSCNHTFHRACAENRLNKKNKSDCRVCEKPLALLDALRSSENIIENMCSICSTAFDPKPDLVTTSCQHTFHRTCAKNRVEEKNKSDCRICQKPSALAEALGPNEPIIEDECIICEKVFKLEEDVLITSCRHTFHRACAENRLNKTNKSDCRVCQRPAALADALLPNQPTVERECLICEEPLNHLVTTSCHHTFHRACARNRLDEEKQTDCHVCHKDAALANALRGNTIVSTRDDTQRISIQTQSRPYVETGGYGATKSVVTKGSPVVTKEVYWECKHCSMSNEPSSNRCGSCGKPRHVHSPSSHEAPSPMDFQATREEPDTSTLIPSYVQPKILVYIMDLPSLNKSDSELTDLIRHRIETTFRLTLVGIECYSKLGIGFVRVKDPETKQYLIQTIGRLALSPQDASATILFTETLNYVSYIVLNTTIMKDDMDWPKPEVVSSRWAEVYSGDKPHSCEVVNIQFLNIYRIVSSSFDQLHEIMGNQDFGINSNISARVYLDADCSYIENLSRSITEDQIRKAISYAMGKTDSISKLDLHIQLNKQTNNVCIIAANMARKLSTKTIYFGQQPITTTENLTMCLLIDSNPEIYNDDDIIIKHTIFNGKARKIKRRGNDLILEISDKKVFNECIKRKVLRIEENSLSMDIYTPFSNPEDCEIDPDTWYKGEMLRCKVDIMQFVPIREHKIFQFKWNSDIWLKEFRSVKDNNQNARNNNDIGQQGNMTPDQMRHRLRVTVMLNTIAAIRKKSYMTGDREIKLDLNPNIITIIYNHQSKLKHSGPLPIERTPYKITEVKVKNKDCLVEYEDLVRQGKKPLLLNMASATSPGGGYRKGDGAQEENLFRRSDYLRSLDIGLDEYIDNPSERSHCTSMCDLDSCFDSRRMYSMDEYGAIYTSGLTVFRQTEEKGYEFMEEPLTGVCSLAMAAYRHPPLDGNMLAPKYAVGMRKKIENIFSIAYHHKHDSLVLSALGCGAFRNPPEHVAKMFRSVIEQYAGFFELIIFAIIDDHNTGQSLNRQGNFRPFYNELNDEKIKPFSSMNHPITIIGPYRLLSDGATVNDISICDTPPCNFGAKCNQMYDPKHAPEFSHPSLCIEQSLNGKCTKTGDIVHMSSFVHREPCKHGAQCRDIDNKKHAEESEHPSFCPNGGNCQDTTDNHEKEYRHLSLCKFAHKCMDFKKHIKPHCDLFRHYMPNCRHGQYCVEFHDKEHMNNYKHPFPTPCVWTPYNCSFHIELTQNPNSGKSSHTIAHQHCLEYAHVCPFGRNCSDPNSWHWEKWIHVPRMPCKFGEKCTKLNQEDHLNSLTHPNIRDIRIPCKYADKCHERRDPNHLSKYRHSLTFKNSGVVQYFNLNKEIDFIRNQNQNIKRVLDYAEKKNWKSFTIQSIPREIIDWIRTVQPVHRCKPEIFESIILHGHVMSLEYMDNLSKPKFVANSVLQHSQMQRIERLKIPDCAENAKKYITALVADIYGKAGFLKKYMDEDSGSLGTHPDHSAHSADRTELIKRRENILSAQINDPHDMEAIRTKTREIAEASMKLNLNKAGIGYKNDIKVGTNKTIFSILGPHLGHYYGDVVLLFKREILHHPDANFSLQAATSYVSGNCYDWRPWLSDNTKSESTQIELFHKTKLHPSIPGYDYATALELIAITSHQLHKKPSEIDLDKIIERWFKVDSHETIEAHLPPLIPLDYIEHIYIPKKTYYALNENTRKEINDHFRGSMTKSDKDSKEYTKFVVEELDKRFRQNDPHSISRPIRGAVMTIPSTNFNDHYVLPLTISQAFEQYCSDHPKTPKDCTIYIYWQFMNGDMMLTLSNNPIDAVESHGKDPCLICYMAPKPSFSRSNDNKYHEQTSYLNSGQPFQHSIFINERRFAEKSNEFYIGCNTDDVMTVCLEIERSKGVVTLSHAGHNSIYNHQKLSCKFSKTELDMNHLEFIHLSAGSTTVPIRNLIITFQKQEDLHPTFDINFKKNDSSSTPADSTQGQYYAQSTDDQSSESPGIVTRVYNKAGQLKDKLVNKVFGSNDDSSLKPCPNNINCLIQFSDNASTHNSEYSHPCRFAEFCRNPESNLTHPKESRGLPKCSSDKSCKHLGDPFHRAQFHHTDLPFFLIPCRHQKNCRDKTENHQKKYSHGEGGLDKIGKEASQAGIILSSQHEQKPQKQGNASTPLTPCQWDLQCRYIADPKHCEKYSHHSGIEKKDNRTPCRHRAKCYDKTPDHRAKYSHPS